MSSVLKPIFTIPIDTYQAARKVYNLTHVYMVIGDRLESILKDESLSRLDPTSSLDAPTALRKAMVTAFQYAESLPDNLAEEATRKRMDWKYALHLSLDHPGFSAGALCQFRQNLFSSSEASAVFLCLLRFLGEAGLFSKADLKTIDTTHVLTLVCQISRVALLRETMKKGLSWLVSQAPDGLRSAAPPHWYVRYADGRSNRPITLEPADLIATAVRLGADIDQLVDLSQRESLENTDEQSEILFLSQLLEEQFIRKDDGLHWRNLGCLNCSRNRRDERVE